MSQQKSSCELAFSGYNVAGRLCGSRPGEIGEPLRRSRMRFAIEKALGCLAVLALVAPANAAFAAVIVNGDFNGLAGWQVSAGPAPPASSSTSATVTITGGMATVSDSPILANPETVVSVDSNGVATISQTSDFTVSEIDLFQVFTVPTAAQSLQFTLNNSALDTSGLNPPPGFGVSLLDPTTGKALASVPTVSATTDSYYTQDLTTGIASPASGVTVSTVSNLTTISENDLSGLTAGSQAEILFRLIEGGDLSANVSISNVELLSGSGNPGGGGNPGVPEPGTLGMLLVGTTGLVWLKRWRLRFKSTLPEC